MNPGLFDFCCCYPVAGSEKPRLEDLGTGVGTDVASIPPAYSFQRPHQHQPCLREEEY